MVLYSSTAVSMMESESGKGTSMMANSLTLSLNTGENDFPLLTPEDKLINDDLKPCIINRSNHEERSPDTPSNPEINCPAKRYWQAVRRISAPNFQLLFQRLFARLGRSIHRQPAVYVLVPVFFTAFFGQYFFVGFDDEVDFKDLVLQKDTPGKSVVMKYFDGPENKEYKAEIKRVLLERVSANVVEVLPRNVTASGVHFVDVLLTNKKNQNKPSSSLSGEPKLDIVKKSSPSCVKKR
jgi:hypothetical protein